VVHISDRHLAWVNLWLENKEGTDGDAAHERQANELAKTANTHADDSNLTAVMAPRTRAALAKLKDSDNNALQKPDLVQAIRMAHTANMPIDESQGTASDASSIIMGNFTHLMWGVRTSMNVRKLDQLYAANGQVGIKCYTRVDFQIDNVKQFAKIIGVIP